MAQTRTQEGAERAKERRRKIQGRAGTQSICAPAEARVSDDAYISAKEASAERNGGITALQMASERADDETAGIAVGHLLGAEGEGG